MCIIINYQFIIRHYYELSELSINGKHKTKQKKWIFINIVAIISEFSYCLRFRFYISYSIIYQLHYYSVLFIDNYPYQFYLARKKNIKINTLGFLYFKDKSRWKWRLKMKLKKLKKQKKINKNSNCCVSFITSELSVFRLVDSWATG